VWVFMHQRGEERSLAHDPTSDDHDHTSDDHDHTSDGHGHKSDESLFQTGSGPHSPP
jgi:hypothetical protein